MDFLNSLAIFGIPLWALIGFMLASFAIVANDVIQTLGTFLASNGKRPWVLLWFYASSIIVAVMAYGWFVYGGDIAFDRLNSIPYPENGIKWWHAVPPLFLLVLTRFGVPVSTTFLVLTIFSLSGGAATEGVLGNMLFKSLMGYVVAFAAGAVIYAIVSRVFEVWIGRTQHQATPLGWIVAQWLSTAFLWSQWLMQDLANIFVYLPRETATNAAGETVVSFSGGMIIFATILMLVLHAIIFATRGGEIQKIVLRKTNTVDPRAATLVDLTFGFILLYFKQLNDIPMSTTWVFLGLLAGRETAISFVTDLRKPVAVAKDLLGDAGRAAIGLVVSVILALSLPSLAKGEIPTLTDLRVQVFGAPESTEPAEPAPKTEVESDSETGSGSSQ